MLILKPRTLGPLQNPVVSNLFGEQEEGGSGIAVYTYNPSY
jgi:hypothetical protein